MNAKTLVAFLAVMTSAGCVIRGGGQPPPPAQPGDVTFSWSFSGQTCADVPSVKSVVVEIAGETLDNNGVFPCLANNYPGIVLHDFAAGSYDFTLTAVGYGNQVLYQGGGTVVVNGSVRANVDLTPAGGPNSYGFLTWRFPAQGGSQDPTCAQAGVSSVDISIDQGPAVRVACAEGFTASGWQTGYLDSGSHSIFLSAVDASNFVRYQVSGTLVTMASNPASNDYSFQWAVGGAVVSWQFPSGYSCSQVAVSNVYVNFYDASTMTSVYAVPGNIQSCNAISVAYELHPGTYAVDIVSDSNHYVSNTAAPVTVVVTAGVFPTNSLVVPLYYQ